MTFRRLPCFIVLPHDGTAQIRLFHYMNICILLQAYLQKGVYTLPIEGVSPDICNPSGLLIQ